MSLRSTSAVLLRSYPYSESSRILRFYTEELGVVGVLARGVRKSGGRRGGNLSTFCQGTLSLHHRENRDLQTFREFAPSKPRRGLAQHPLRLAGASVLAELVLQHAEGEGNPPLFWNLSRGLDGVESEPMELLLPRLLMEIWNLVRELGYEPILDRCVECGRPLEGGEVFRFDLPAGGLRCRDCQERAQGPRLGPRARLQLAGLLQGDLRETLMRPRAHLRLAGDFITYHISGGTPLRSMDVLATLIPKGHA